MGCHLRFSANPHVVTILGTTVALAIVHQWRGAPSSRRLWLYVPLVLVWCNLDSRAWLGLALLVLYAAGDGLAALLKSPTALSATERKTLWQVVGVSAAAMLVHPFGWKSLAAPWMTYAVEYPGYRNYISETYLDSAEPLPVAGSALNFFPMTSEWFWTNLDLAAVASLAVLAAMVVTLILNRSRLDWGYVAAAAGFVFLAAACLHELPVATIVCCAVATLNGQAWYAATCRQTYSTDRGEVLLSQGGRVLTVLVIAGIAFFGGTGRLRDAAATSVQTGYGLDRTIAMQLEDLQRLLAGDASFDDRPFHTLMTQGDQLIWAGQKVFVDSRVGVYFDVNDDDNLLAQHLLTREALCPSRAQSGSATSRRAGWRKTLDKYHATHVVIRLASRRDYGNFGLILQDTRDWEWTGLGAAAAVFYRIDVKDDPRLAEYTKTQAIDFRKRAYDEAAGNESELSVRSRGIQAPSFYQRYFWTHRRQSTGEVHEALHLAALAASPALPRRIEASRTAMAYLAIRKAQAGLARDPDDVNGYLALGGAYDLLAKIEAATSNGFRAAQSGVRYLQSVCAYNQALVGSPDSVAAHQALMQIYGEARKLDLVLRHSEKYEELLSADPVANDQELMNLGTQISQLRKARETIEDEIAPHAATENDTFRLAQAYYQRGCVLSALREIERGGTPAAHSLAAERFYILLLLEAGRVDEAYNVAGRFALAAEQAGFREGTDVVAVASLVAGEYRVAADQWMRIADDAEKRALNDLLLSLAPHSPWPLLATQRTFDFLFQRPEATSGARTNSALAYLEWGAVNMANRLFHDTLAANPDARDRPLIAFYIADLTEGKEEIDPVSPSNRIIESFAPEPGAEPAPESRPESGSDAGPDQESRPEE
jgi:hypothetical protein